MKDTELKLICALMKNGRRSDRELAKAIGSSQPTVSRMIKKLEKEGIIKEYTMIPDFHKLEFEIAAITFIRFRKDLSEEERKELRNYSREAAKGRNGAILMAVDGMGLGYDQVFISFHEDYTSYAKSLSEVRKFPYFDPSHLDSFLIDLTDERHFQPLTLSAIANYLLRTKEEKL
jgi:DNA-binding Lrp family transcriptional regulator